MKQIIQSFKTGETMLEEIPAPMVRPGAVLIQTTRTLVSLGTEKMLVEFGKSNIISKARQQPEKVKQVIDKVKSDGLLPTLDAVFNKLGTPLPLGYCNVGKVIAVGAGVSGFSVGDRVASNGPHAEVVCVPKNLVCLIPDDVSDDEATFTVIGSIGLQGIRLLNPTLGETIVVIGLGLIGLLTAKLLLANGCNVIGVDIDRDKLKLAESFGVTTVNGGLEDVVKFVESATGEAGADGVIITASARGNELISQSARMSRKRGRIVLVGVTGLDINRSEFYQKELSFQVSCSYGPGRYDEAYEGSGNDYPLPFVRWTENRNFSAVLNAIATRRLNVKDLITEVIPVEEFATIYNNISTKKSIASILAYNSSNETMNAHSVNVNHASFGSSKGVVGIIGAGNFTRMTMLPALKAARAHHKYIVSAAGVNAAHLAKKYGFALSSTNYRDVLSDNDVDLVMITTRHDSHASMAVEALTSGKHVFVEKPLALNYRELDAIIGAYNGGGMTLTVGFNRRFSPHAIKVKSVLGNGIINVIATMNAGFIPADSWVHDVKTGGGRLIGEACHFIDLITYFTGSKVVAVCANAMGFDAKENTDNASVLLKYENGSTGTINYFSNGAKSYPKERIEVYSMNRTAVIDNFRKTTGYGFKGLTTFKTSLDKGHRQQFVQLLSSVRNGGEALIPFHELVNTTRASFAIIESLKKHSWIDVS